MSSEQWPEKLFKNFARQDEQQPFTQGRLASAIL